MAEPWENIYEVATSDGETIEEDFGHGIGHAKNPKSVSKTAKRGSKSFLNHAWRPLEGPKTAWDHKKSNLGVWVHPRCMPKGLQIGPPEETETTQNEASKPSAKEQGSRLLIGGSRTCF